MKARDTAERLTPASCATSIDRTLTLSLSATLLSALTDLVAANMLHACAVWKGLRAGDRAGELRRSGGTGDA